jgi:hypothetical protein
MKSAVYTNCKRYESYFKFMMTNFYILKMGARNSAVGSGTVLQAGRSRVRFPIVSEFFIDIIVPAAIWPWG